MEQLETLVKEIDFKRHWKVFVISMLGVYWFVSFPLFSWVFAKFHLAQMIPGIMQFMANNPQFNPLSFAHK